MIENLRPEDVQRNAQRIGESLRASLFYLADLIAGHNDENAAEHVDPSAVISTAAIKFVKPTGGMISGLMGQFNVLLVQVVPVEPTHTLGHLIEQGYHVVPSNMLAMWKQIILEAHANAVGDLLEAFAEEDEGGEEDPQDQSEPVSEVAPASGSEITSAPPSEPSEEV